MQTPDSAVTHSIRAPVSHLCSLVDRQPEARRHKICVCVRLCVCKPGSSDIIIRRQRGLSCLMDGTLHSPCDPATSHPKWPSSQYLIKITTEQRNGWKETREEGWHRWCIGNQVLALCYTSLYMCPLGGDLACVRQSAATYTVDTGIKQPLHQ